ncbi:MAG: response regulator [Candidatus Nitrospinota bacterium M3_3B_026]
MSPGETKVLVVDDEEDLRELLRYNLENAGYATAMAATGEEALEKTADGAFDLVILDLMLPGIGGLDVCKRLRGEEGTKNLPIIMLTAKGEEEDIIKGLELGADDYVVKPFSVVVLLARIQAVLRRKSAPPSPEMVSINSLTVDRRRRQVLLDGELLDFTYSEFSILDALIQRGGGVMTRQQIVSAIRGGQMTVTERSVDVHITAIRKKLGEAGRRLLTVRGVGYRFDI